MTMAQPTRLPTDQRPICPIRHPCQHEPIAPLRSTVLPLFTGGDIRWCVGFLPQQEQPWQLQGEALLRLRMADAWCYIGRDMPPGIRFTITDPHNLLPSPRFVAAVEWLCYSTSYPGLDLTARDPDEWTDWLDAWTRWAERQQEQVGHRCLDLVVFDAGDGHRQAATVLAIAHGLLYPERGDPVAAIEGLWCDYILPMRFRQYVEAVTQVQVESIRAVVV